METLAKPLRKQLEDAVVTARDEAENAARAAHDERALWSLPVRTGGGGVIRVS